MPLRSKQTLRDVNTYHHNHSLLFQFILSEFIIAYSQLQKMQSSVSHLKETAKRSSLIEQDHQLLETLMTSVSKLAGSSQDYMRIFSWNYDDGVLAKLKNYSAIISQNAVREDKDMAGLHRNANKAWLACLQTLDLLRMLLQQSKKATTLDESLHIEFQAAFHKMSAALQRFARTTAQFLKQFKEDENVILFILRHHDQIDALYEPKFVAKLFNKMYSKKLAGARQFLINAYTKRGFDHLLPAINTKFAELQHDK